jgi:hypothetical protein
MLPIAIRVAIEIQGGEVVDENLSHVVRYVVGISIDVLPIQLGM